MRFAKYFSSFLRKCDGAQGIPLLFLAILGFSLLSSPAGAENSGTPASPSSASAPPAPAALSPLAEYEKQLAENSDQSSEFFFNLGTLYLKEKKSNEAFASLQKAVFLKPWVMSNWKQLRLAAEKLSPDVIEYRPDHWYSWWPSDLQTISWRWFLTATLLCSALYFLLSISKGWRQSSARNSALGGAVLFLTLFFFSFLQQSTPSAILMKASASLAGPANSYPEVRRLPVGARLSVEENRKDWCKVRFRNPEGESQVAWVPCLSILNL